MHRAYSLLKKKGPPTTGRFPEPHDFGRSSFKYILIIPSRLHICLTMSCSKIKTLHALPCHYISYNYSSNILNSTQSLTHLHKYSCSCIHLKLVTIRRRVANLTPRPPLPRVPIEKSREESLAPAGNRAAIPLLSIPQYGHYKHDMIYPL